MWRSGRTQTRDLLRVLAWMADPDAALPSGSDGVSKAERPGAPARADSTPERAGPIAQAGRLLASLGPYAGAWFNTGSTPILACPCMMIDTDTLRQRANAEAGMV